MGPELRGPGHGGRRPRPGRQRQAAFKAAVDGPRRVEAAVRVHGAAEAARRRVAVEHDLRRRRAAARNARRVDLHERRVVVDHDVGHAGQRGPAVRRGRVHGKSEGSDAQIQGVEAQRLVPVCRRDDGVAGRRVAAPGEGEPRGGARDALEVLVVRVRRGKRQRAAEGHDAVPAKDVGDDGGPTDADGDRGGHVAARADVDGHHRERVPRGRVQRVGRELEVARVSRGRREPRETRHVRLVNRVERPAERDGAVLRGPPVARARDRVRADAQRRGPCRGLDDAADDL